MTKKWGLILLSISVIATLASAQTQEERLEAALKKYPEADTNKDGTLTRKEAMAHMALAERASDRIPDSSLSPVLRNLDSYILGRVEAARA